MSKPTPRKQVTLMEMGDAKKGKKVMNPFLAGMKSVDNAMPNLLVPLGTSLSHDSDNDSDNNFMLPECLEREEGAATAANDGSLLWTLMQRQESEDWVTVEEENRKKMLDQASKSGLMFGPESAFRMKWDLAQFGMLLYIAVLVPWRIGFSQTAPLWSFAFFFDLVVDMYFVADVLINFRTAVIDGEGDVIYEQTKVARTYLKGWFTIDVVSCLPLNYLEYLQDDNDAATDMRSNRMSRLVKLARLTKLLKMLRLARVKRLLDRWEEDLYSVAAYKMVKLLIVVFGISHWLACCWYYCGDDDGGGLIDPEGNLAVGWVTRHFGGQSNADLWDRYIAAYYWALMTVTTVGYGDIAPQTGFERGYAVIAMAIGGVVFGLIIGSLSLVIRDNNPGDTARKTAMGEVMAFLHDRHVPKHTQRHIRSFYREYFLDRSVIKEYDIFHNLPERQKKELAVALDYLEGDNKGGAQRGAKNSGTSHGVLHRIPFLQGLEWYDLIKVCMRLKTVQIRQALHINGSQSGPVDNYICSEGKGGHEMYVITEGSVMIEKDGVQLGRLRKYDFFGELAVLVGSHMQNAGGLPPPRLRSAWAYSRCKLNVLSLDDINELRVESGAIDRAVRKAAIDAIDRQPSLLTDTRRIREVFDKLDTDVSGEIDGRELDKLLAGIGFAASGKEVMAQMDTDGDGKISFEEFSEWWGKMKVDQHKILNDPGRNELAGVGKTKSRDQIQLSDYSSSVTGAASSRDGGATDDGLHQKVDSLAALHKELATQVAVVQDSLARIEVAMKS